MTNHSPEFVEAADKLRAALAEGHSDRIRLALWGVSRFFPESTRTELETLLRSRHRLSVKEQPRPDGQSELVVCDLTPPPRKITLTKPDGSKLTATIEEV